MNIEKAAKELASALKNDINFSNVKDYVENNLGYNVLFIGTERGDKELEKHRLTANHEKTAFTYKTTTVKIVFVNSNSSESDKLIATLHECGHIIAGHVDVASYVIDSEKAEKEANQFAYSVLLAAKRHRKNRHRIPCVILTVLVLLLGSALALELLCKPDEAVFDAVPVDNIYDETQITTVYITPYGTRYHSSDCVYIKNKTNVIPVELSDISDGYEPCKVCNPPQRY